MILQSPLFSLSARGRFSGLGVLQARHRKISLTTDYTREDPCTSDQEIARDRFIRAVAFWKHAGITDNEKTSWGNLSSPLRMPLPGYHLFIKNSILSLGDSENPAMAVASEIISGLDAVWYLRDLITRGQATDTQIYDVYSYNYSTGFTKLHETQPTENGRIILPKENIPSGDVLLTILCNSVFRSGLSPILPRTNKTYQDLLDNRMRWMDALEKKNLWGDFLE